ncbi:MAG: hypothetical protein QNK19_02795, partial [Xanthomonadales bacterium]|nr:hypothetical protein [Xanthomonadales bacterium]
SHTQYDIGGVFGKTGRKRRDQVTPVIFVFWKNSFCSSYTFDLEVTPNYAARIEAAGMPWPAFSPINFPLKD